MDRYIQSSISSEYHKFAQGLSQTTMFDEYIRGKICCLGIEVSGGRNKDGELHLRRIFMANLISSKCSTALDDTLSSNNNSKRVANDGASTQCNRKSITNKVNEPVNTSRAANIDSSKLVKGVHKNKKISLPTHLQSTATFYVANFLSYQEKEPDNTSFALTENDKCAKS